MMKRTLLMLVAVAVASPAFAQAPVEARTGVDARWAPWLGCWQLLEDSVGAEATSDRRARQPRGARGTEVCLEAGDRPAAVTLSTMVGDRPVTRETVVADGADQPIVEDDCRGLQRAEWSAGGQRLYSKATLACRDQPERTISGLALMTPGPIWIDIQLIEVGAQKNIRVRRYQRSSDTLPARALAPLHTRWTLADVQETAAKVAPEVLQAALVETRAGFDLTGRALIDLSDAGVHEDVLDLMVALSYPDRFVVEPRRGGGWAGWGGDWGGAGGLSPWGLAGFYPGLTDDYFWSSYYSPFGYRYYGAYNPYYSGNYGFVPIEPSRPGPAEPVASGAGRVVNGRGYTRIHSREAERAEGSGASSGGTWGTSSAGNTGSTNSGAAGGSSGVSSGGYSSGGSSGGDAPRTAQPRPPGAD